MDNKDLGASADAERAAHEPSHANELERLREWRDTASLTLSDLREQVEVMRRALKRTQGWLALLGRERPETSDVHDVAAAVIAALRIPAQAIQTRRAETGEDAGSVGDESAVPQGCAQTEDPE